MRKRPIIIDALSIFKLVISQATGVNSSDNLSVDMFMSAKGLFKEVVCCRLDQSFMRSIDGKYCSATVPLVFLVSMPFSEIFTIFQSRSEK